MQGLRLVLVLTLLVLASACSGDDAVETTTTSSGVSSSTVATPETTTTGAVATTTTSTTTTTTTTTEPPPTGPPAGSVLITGEAGVFVATLDGVAAKIIDADELAVNGLIDFAIDDARGGIVFQPNRGSWFFRGSDSIVYWVPTGAGTYQELLVPDADQGLALEDVASHGASAAVYYTRTEGGDDPETTVQTLRRFDLDDKTVTEIAVVGGWESGSSPISAGGDLIVKNSGAEGYVWIDFMDLDGVEFDSPANPLPLEEFDCFPGCFYYADLSPDGSRVALGRLAPNADGFPTTPEIEIRDVATGALELAVSLPDVAAFPWIHSMDLSDTHVLINIIEEGSEYPFATIVDIASGGLATYPAPVGGVARFLRSMPALDGVVAWP
ncbi:MAG: hypothetical protein QNJ77_06590 [Acidimicrobiia bacterium]|nr:hypothetical protein [Acidimicrobiia bacterium]